MTLETRISSGRIETRMEGNRGRAPLAEAPSYIRFMEFASRRVGGGGLTEPAHTTPARRSESKHVVDNASAFLGYNRTREIVWEEILGLGWPLGFDVSPSNWDVFRPDTAADGIHQVVQANDDTGLCSGHYRFVVYTELKVTLVFSEPKALLRYCREKVTPTTVEHATGGDPCGVCSDGLTTSPDGTPPVNLCGHAFHSHCIFEWFFKGTVCPICQHDLRGLVAAPWAGLDLSSISAAQADE